MKERVRRRRRDKAIVPEAEALVRELQDALLQGPDPEVFPVPTLQEDGTVSKPQVVDQLNTLISRRSKEVMPFYYMVMMRFKMSGMTHAAIADRLGVSESTIDHWSVPAQKWMREHCSDKLEPATFLADQQMVVNTVLERLWTMISSTTNVADTARLASALTTIMKMNKDFLKDFGYFDAVQYGRITSEKDSAAKTAAKTAKQLDKIFQEGLAVEDDAA